MPQKLTKPQPKKREDHMKTKLHTFRIDTSKPEGRQEWDALKARLKADPGRGKWMEAMSAPGNRHDPEPGEIELETDFLFGNQWNSDKGRVFDFYSEVIYNYGRRSPWRTGHYLDITPEMIAIRRETLVSGWTEGKFKASDGVAFDLRESTLGGDYLHEKDLHLLRLLPVAESFGGNRPELTPEERAMILPLYLAAQTKANGERATAKAEKVRAEFVKDLHAKEREIEGYRAGWTFLLDRGLNVGNVIYYDHTGEFCFGWQGGYGPELEKQWRELLKDFPSPFTIRKEGEKS